MRFDYDMDADALYVTITREPVAATHPIEDLTSVDVDAEGSPVGIEVIAPVRAWAIDKVLTRYQIADDDRDLLLAHYGSGRFSGADC
ncbi:DUF2283 domain-containing protein [Nonomuraea sp. CA-218870]|uniref:DUF2283 domain-containing protein n=1 Tax=Nonomuraea sp. CA-218870 TaxID=3239998 RepID=UPI003D923B2E